MPWPDVVADLQRCMQSKMRETVEAGRFVDVSGVKGVVVANCIVNPSGVIYRIDVELRIADAPF